MMEPTAAPDVPKEVPYTISAPLQFSDAMLRVCGHPGLLAAAATINGDDFVPRADSIIVKKPGEGGSFAWHQDGTTHWGTKKWNPDIHGFNLMVQMYRCTAANSVWFIPGTHLLDSRIDIKKLVADAGSNRLPGAVPLICNPGDVAISNRQVLHGSFPNTSSDWRATIIIGLLRRSAVVGVNGKSQTDEAVSYDLEHVRKRAEMIGYAIDARRQRFPNEKSFTYRPHTEAGERYVWDETAREKIRNYQANDIFI
jgi:ectoine hydroxylase-related dioxygenase (phytanoyl-CoA dioxygenase family)